MARGRHRGDEDPRHRPPDRRRRAASTGSRSATSSAARSWPCAASRVIDATGVWLGHPEARLGGSTMKLVPSRGSHLLFERDRIPMRTGLTLKIPGRVLFVIPSPGAWIVGTTDEPDAGAPDRPAPTGHEVDHILETVNGVLALDLSREDALGAYAGLRPLVGVPGGDTARISREHTIHREASGLVRVSGGKYTTYRLMARDAVDVALEGRDRAPRSIDGRPRRCWAQRHGTSSIAWPSELAARDGLDAGRAEAARRPPRHAGPRRPGAGPGARPAAAAGRRHPAARGRGRLGRPPRAGPRAGRRAVATDAPVDGPPRSRRQHRGARGCHHGRRPGLGRGPPGGRGRRLPGQRRSASTTCLGRARGDPGPADVSDRFVLALDQGTTSSRAIVFDRGGQPVALAQQEFPQGYPFPGHVTHDPEDIWQSQLAVAREAVAQVPGGIASIAALGRHQPARDDHRLGARHRVAPWRRPSSGRVASRPSAARRSRDAGHEPRVRALTGLPLDAYFSGPKIAHILDARAGPARPGRGRRALLRDRRQLPGRGA